MNRTQRTLPGIDHEFSDPGLLREALTHRSHSSQNNERLEFLGDAVLNFVIAAELFHVRPDDNEGSLSRRRARGVRGETLVRVARQFVIDNSLQ